MLRHFLENGVHIGDRELSSGDWGSNWRMGFIMWQTGERGSNAGIRGSFAQEKILGFKKMKNARENFGVQEKQKKENNNPERMWCSGHGLSLRHHLFWYPGRRFSVFEPSFLRTRRILVSSFFFADSDGRC